LTTITCYDKDKNVVEMKPDDNRKFTFTIPLGECSAKAEDLVCAFIDHKATTSTASSSSSVLSSSSSSSVLSSSSSSSVLSSSSSSSVLSSTSSQSASSSGSEAGTTPSASTSSGSSRLLEEASLTTTAVASEGFIIS
jgi:hypothetical protein